jgi:PST family polysaccharide transporter
MTFAGPFHKKQAARAAMWRLLDLFYGQTVTFFAFTILARLLAPEDFGVVALAAAIVAIPSVLNEGLGTTLVQRDLITDDQITTAFWLNLIISLFFVVVMQIGASWAAQIAGMALLEPVLRWLSVVLIATAAASVPIALYTRKLTYSRLAKRTFLASSGSAIVAIVMALLGFGIWSLVAMQLWTAVLSTLVMWIKLEWRPKLSFSGRTMRDMLHFSSRVMIGTAFRTLTVNTSTLIIGLSLGPGSLGYYYLVDRLLTTIATVTITPVDSIMLPVLSRLNDDVIRRAEAYAKLIGLNAAIWIPSLFGLAILGPTLLPLLFGHKWDGAIPMIVIIAPAVAVSWSLTWPAAQLLLAAGQSGTFMSLRIINLVTNASCFLVAVRFGITGVACAYAAASIFMVPITLLSIKSTAGVALARVLKHYARALAASLGMALVLLWLKWIMPPGLPGLAIEVGSGITVYAGAYYALARSNMTEYAATALEAFR